MIVRREPDRHSDLGPSSKDWLPGSEGRDEDFSPDKDLWTISRKGNVGRGRPGEDIQPGTGEPGRSWKSRRPDPDDPDDQLDQALADTFPASDPPQPTQPGVTGWDLSDEERRSSLGPAYNRTDGRAPARRQVRRGSPALPFGMLALALLHLVFVSVQMAQSRRRPRRSRPRRRGF